MRWMIPLLLCALLSLRHVADASSINLTGAYAQNFDALGTVTISNAVSPTIGVQTSLGAVVSTNLNGWYVAKIGGTGTSPTSIVANNGTWTSGGVANYGNVESPNRSLGSLSTGSMTPAFGALIRNGTGQTLLGIRLIFTAKFWRSSTTSQNTLTFGYGIVDGGTVTTDNFLTFAEASSLTLADIVGPPPVSTSAPLDGDNAFNQTTFDVYVPILLPPNETMFIRWQDLNDAGNDAGIAIDNVVLSANTGPSLEEAASQRPFNPTSTANWASGGSAWQVDFGVSHDGVDSVKAQTTDGQSTYREYTVTGPAVVDFWWKVSSEQLYDTFSYSLNSANQETISGEVDWTYRTLTLPAGTHTIRWTYTKDGSDAVGQDAGWLDDFTVYPATATLQVRDGATVLTGLTTLDFGSADLGSAGFTKTLTLSNEGFVPLQAQLSLPTGSPFTFQGGGLTYEIWLGRGESVAVPISLATTTAGSKSVQLTISAPDSTVSPPSITLTGNVRGPEIGLVQGATTLGSGQTFNMGLAPRTVEFTIRNNGNVGNLLITGILAGGNFQITQEPATTIPPQTSTTFKVLATSAAVGNQTGGIAISSSDPNTPLFTISLAAKSFAAIPEGVAEGSVATSGTGGAVGWDFATTQLPSGQNGQALKTGTTPNNGGSALEFTAQTAGVVSWSWKVGSQENFDWLVCEVDGREVAGISTKNGVWQTQVIQVPAGANVFWVYRKDGAASAGEDAGYLSDVEFRSFAANQSFGRWADTYGLYDPQQRLPKSGMKTKFAWLGGIDPGVGLNADHHVPIMEGGLLKYRFPISKTADGTQQILFSPDMSSWTTRRFSQRIVSEDADRVVIEATAPSGMKGFFKVVGSGDASINGMAPIPAGSFSMGDAFGEGGSEERPVHTVNVSAFYMDKYEVTKALWDEVANWAAANGYDISAASADGKAANHPAYNITWYEAVKWSNARSEKENLTPCYTVGGAVMKTGTSTPDCNFSASGYRLPTEAEWEKAARGGLSGKRFPWGDTITHSEANYRSDASYSYDVSPTRSYHPTYATGSFTYSSPVGSFAPNGYGLYDMAGNMWEWCWDWYSDSYYASSPSSDPRGATSGSSRVVRGGSWLYVADFPRTADRVNFLPGNDYNVLGFRCVRSSVP